MLSVVIGWRVVSPGSKLAFFVIFIDIMEQIFIVWTKINSTVAMLVES